jgi:hypothetical protein
MPSSLAAGKAVMLQPPQKLDRFPAAHTAELPSSGQYRPLSQTNPIYDKRPVLKFYPMG